MRPIRIAVPDLVSNSYFPAIAACALGHFETEGLQPRLELIFPNHRTFAALRDGDVDLVAGPAHAALQAFPDWRGLRLLCALSQGTVWLLVLRASLPGASGDVSAIRGLRIGAAPLVDLTLKQLLRDSGLDPERDVSIVGVPGASEPGVSFGVAAARALEGGSIDGFWANAMGAENALRDGVGKLLLDVRRGHGPAEAPHYTFSTLATSERRLREDRPLLVAGTRAVLMAQRDLRLRPELAGEVGRRFFPEQEAARIADIVRRDVAFYDPAITDAAIAGLNRFAQRAGLATCAATRESLVSDVLTELGSGPP